jgi:predicted nicotinamide N-methyase
VKRAFKAEAGAAASRHAASPRETVRARRVIERGKSRVLSPNTRAAEKLRAEWGTLGRT